MKLRVVTCVLALAALLSLGCNQSALLSLQEENARLKEQVKRLQAELATPQAAPPQTKTNSTPAKAAPNETVNVPAALLAEAKSYADRKMWPNAVPALKSLLAIYPDAAEVPEAKRLLKEAETENKEIGDSTDQKQEQQEKKRPGQVVNPVKYLERKIDEVEGITWFYSWHSPHFHLRGGAAFYVYIGMKNGDVWKRFKARYDGYKWLFFNKILVKADDKLFTIAINEFRDNKKDIFGGHPSETVDLAVDPAIQAMLEAVAKAKKVIVRFSGKYDADFVLTPNQKAAIGEILTAYREIS